jgi:hypothetical protein
MAIFNTWLQDFKNAKLQAYNPSSRYPPTPTSSELQNSNAAVEIAGGFAHLARYLSTKGDSLTADREKLVEQFRRWCEVTASFNMFQRISPAHRGILYLLYEGDWDGMMKLDENETLCVD